MTGRIVKKKPIFGLLKIPIFLLLALALERAVRISYEDAQIGTSLCTVSLRQVQDKFLLNKLKGFDMVCVCVCLCVYNMCMPHLTSQLRRSSGAGSHLRDGEDVLK